jgi:hypothetical protein
VVTSFPLRTILHNSNATGNIAKWAAELAEFRLDFQPRHAIKSQVLADFIVEWTPPASIPKSPDPDSGPTPMEPGTALHRAPLDALLRRIRPPTRWRGRSDPHRSKRRSSEVYGAP